MASQPCPVTSRSGKVTQTSWCCHYSPHLLWEDRFKHGPWVPTGSSPRSKSHLGQQSCGWFIKSGLYRASCTHSHCITAVLGKDLRDGSRGTQWEDSSIWAMLIDPGEHVLALSMLHTERARNVREARLALGLFHGELWGGPCRLLGAYRTISYGISGTTGSPTGLTGCPGCFCSSSSRPFLVRSII